MNRKICGKTTTASICLPLLSPVTVPDCAISEKFRQGKSVVENMTGCIRQTQPPLLSRVLRHSMRHLVTNRVLKSNLDNFNASRSGSRLRR